MDSTDGSFLAIKTKQITSWPTSNLIPIMLVFSAGCNAQEYLLNTYYKPHLTHVFISFKSRLITSSIQDISHCKHHGFTLKHALI